MYTLTLGLTKEEDVAACFEEEDSGLAEEGYTTIITNSSSNTNTNPNKVAGDTKGKRRGPCLRPDKPRQPEPPQEIGCNKSTDKVNREAMCGIAHIAGKM